jgi:hypothetical protein
MQLTTVFAVVHNQCRSTDLVEADLGPRLSTGAEGILQEDQLPDTTTEIIRSVTVVRYEKRKGRYPHVMLLQIDSIICPLMSVMVKWISGTHRSWG